MWLVDRKWNKKMRQKITIGQNILRKEQVSKFSFCSILPTDTSEIKKWDKRLLLDKIYYERNKFRNFLFVAFCPLTHDVGRLELDGLPEAVRDSINHTFGITVNYGLIVSLWIPWIFFLYRRYFVNSLSIIDFSCSYNLCFKN